MPKLFLFNKCSGETLKPQEKRRHLENRFVVFMALWFQSPVFSKSATTACR